MYGLCAAASHEDAARALSRLKGRAETQPVALLAAGLDAVLGAVPELAGKPAVQAEALLPGAYTLVLPNPARRFAWLTGDRPDTIGVRVPDLQPDARAVVERVGAVAATSANRHGCPDPARVEDIPAELVAGVAAVVDAGPLPGTPSTVLDLTGPEPAVLREGGGSVEDALRRLRVAYD